MTTTTTATVTTGEISDIVLDRDPLVTNTIAIWMDSRNRGQNGIAELLTNQHEVIVQGEQATFMPLPHA